ncbi:MAG: hypothetical protein LRS43_04520, partial [Desulfurococcales archaeon]|nr:hypothetical protein [Desulfurococcales archaeon]
VALVNSGYESDTPQLMVPVGTARSLGLWPPPPDSREEVFDTAGGPLRVWVARNAVRVQVIAGGARSRLVEADLVISPLADEPLISDQLAGELEIAVEDFARGLWRFRWEGREALRESERRRA